jgi:(p)ppGpp synthase/HD superfamily hydrolase
MLSKAILIASTQFKSKVDRAGAPYILHLLTVMHSVEHLGYEAMAAAVLHDLLEDIPGWTGERLAHEGMSDTVVSTVMLLTKKEDQAYESYIGGLSFSKLAVEIKLSDLRHNMDMTRLKEPTEKDLARLCKYIKAYKQLMSLSGEPE